MKIGFYDSGLGGTTVLNEALKNITNGIFIERHPSKMLPVNTHIIEELEKDFGDNAKEIFQTRRLILTNKNNGL